MDKIKAPKLVRVLNRQDIVFTKKASSFVQTHSSQAPRETPKFCESAQEAYFVMDKLKSFEMSSTSADEKSPGSVTNLPQGYLNFEITKETPSIEAFKEFLVSPQF